MKKFLILSVLFIACFKIQAQTDSLANEAEARVRGGLPNFFSKLRKGNKVKVAYLGGSITRADNGWRDQTFQWLQNRYSDVQFEQIMAAIGGTGSDFGAHRLQNHVLEHSPDLVFVEFAVNDNGRTAQQVKESMEGIVRQIWQKNRLIDICFVYTFSKPQVEFYQKGKFPPSASAMEVIADHYRIPSVGMALPVVKLINEGKMILQGKVKENPNVMVFSEDGVHPLGETGHKIYAETVERHLEAFQTIGKPGKHALKKALMPDNLENARMLWAEKVEKSPGWHRVDSVVVGKAYASLLPSVYASEDTNEVIKFTFKGSGFGIVDIMGPSSGQIVVWIDKEPPRYINRFDEYATYYRMNYSLISGLSAGKHEAVIKVSPNKLDKAAILSKRNNKMSNPQLYEKQVFYVGAFLFRE